MRTVHASRDAAVDRRSLIRLRAMEAPSPRAQSTAGDGEDEDHLDDVDDEDDEDDDDEDEDDEDDLHEEGGDGGGPG